MGLFNAKIKDLEQQLLAMTGERDQLKLSVDDLTAANAQCEERHNADQLAITGLTTERDTAVANLGVVTTERDTAQRDLKAEREGRETEISTQVNQRLASAGIDPIKRDPKAIVDTPAGGKAAGTARERLAASFNQQIQK